MSVYAVVASALLGTVIAQASPPLPSLPNQFEARVSCNIVNENFTVNVHEVYDLPGNRAAIGQYHSNMSSPRQDQQNVSQYVRTIYQYSNDEYFHTNITGCFGGKIDQLPNNNPFGGTDGGFSITPTRDFFAFGAEWNETYMGVTNINGVPCNHWRSTNTTAMTSMQLDYFFSVPSWGFPFANQSQIPVLLNLTGTHPVIGPMGPTGQNRSFHHYYLYTLFHVGPISGRSEYLLQVPNNLTCVGNITQSTIPYASASSGQCVSGDSKTSSGGLAGVAVLAVALVIALAVAVVVTLKAKGSSAPARETKSTVFANPNVVQEV
eukprot:m.177192 g.177192  ORF g.177192 m.177192 type:complete len:321 (+) comp18364_c0_seq1:71-1033(+)